MKLRLASFLPRIYCLLDICKQQQKFLAGSENILNHYQIRFNTLNVLCWHVKIVFGNSIKVKIILPKEAFHLV